MQSRRDRHTDDDSLRALDLIEAAWNEGEENGVPHELMAYAAVFAGMRDLVQIFGREAAAAMAKSLSERIKDGHFSADRAGGEAVH